MSDQQRDKIRTPSGRWFRIWRRRFLPTVVWGLALAAVAVLAQRQVHVIDGTGTVELSGVTVTPLMDGTISGIHVDVLDEVHAGDLIVLMDDTLISAELRVAEAELSRYRATVDAEKSRIEQELATLAEDQADTLRRFLANEEDAHLDFLDRVMTQEEDRVTLQRLQLLEQQQAALARDSLIDHSTYDQTRLAYEALRTKLREGDSALAQAKERLAQARVRRDDPQLGLLPKLDLAERLAPLREAVAEQETRIQEVQERRALLALKAPISGRVSKIFYRAGETVLSGSPILTIASPVSNRILAYVDEKAPGMPAVGTPVEIYSRRQPTDVLRATVLRVGPHIEELPLNLWSSTVIPRRGRPVLVGDVPEGYLYPGESVDLRFRIN